MCLLLMRLAIRIKIPVKTVELKPIDLVINPPLMQPIKKGKII